GGDASPLGALRLFEVGWFVDRSGDGASADVMTCSSIMIRSASFPNLALLLGPQACSSPESIEATLLRVGIRLEEGPTSHGRASTPSPPALCLAFSELNEMEDAAGALGLELVDPCARGRHVDDFGASLGAADEAYLRHAGSMLWSERDATWRTVSQSIDNSPV